MTGESTTLGEVPLSRFYEMIRRVKATMERHGYDVVVVREVSIPNGMLIDVTAGDKFNMADEWAHPDVKDIVAKHVFSLAFADDAAAVEADMHAFIQRQPNRVSRERSHMAWILNGQLERLGNYSSEAREAFQSAFRRSMDEANLRALTHAVN